MRHLILIALLIPSAALADTKLILGGISKHAIQMEPERFSVSPKRKIFAYGRDYQVGGMTHYREVRYNETHPAIGIEKNGNEMTVFKNSLGDSSISMARVTKNSHGFGSRIGVALYENHGFIPVAQFGYFGENYDVTFGMVSTIIFKVKL